MSSHYERRAVFMVADENSERAKSQGYEYGIKAWQKTANSWRADFILSKGDTSLGLRPQFEKYNISQYFDIYGRVLVVDADTIPHPNCPLIFRTSGYELVTAVPNFGSLEWVFRGIENYQKAFFPNVSLDCSDYINTGLMMFSSNHQDMLNKFLSFVKDNQVKIESLTDQLGMGQDQTLFNLFMADYYSDTGQYLKKLPWTFNAQDLQRRFALREPLFITDMAYVFHFNCGCRPSAAHWMEATYNKLWTNK